jgi:hypothetical protein
MEIGRWNKDGRKGKNARRKISADDQRRRWWN